MAKHKVEKRENGRYTIKKVPVFKLGDIRGYCYNRAWSERMLSNMQMRAENDYYPPVIVGHNGFGSELKEKDAIGFMKNFSVEYQGNDPDVPMGTVFCDLDEIPEAAMQDIRDMKYPYRSVEVWNDRAEFSAVALLGGTEPYFKFPRLEVYSQEKGAPVVHNFAIENGELKIEQEGGSRSSSGAEQSGDKKFTLKEFVAEVKRLFAVQVTDTNNEEKKDGSDMDDVKFKETYGMTQEEAGKLANEAAAAKAKVEKLEAEKRKAEIATFSEKLKNVNVAPAVIEKLQEAVSNAENPEAEMKKFMDVVQAAHDGTLFVPMDEQGRHSDKKDPVDPNDTDSLYSAIEAYAEEHKCTFAEAQTAVIREIDKQREGK